MLNLVLFLGACTFATYFDSKFVVWSVKRNLPVPKGNFRLMRFLFWWGLSVTASSAIYFCMLLLLVSFTPGLWNRVSEIDFTVVQFGSLILMAPCWVGILKGIDLQISNR